MDKCYNELKSDFNSRQKLPRLLLKSSPMLQQLSQVYTPPIFNLFQQEHDLRDATFMKERKERKKNEEDETILFEYLISRVDKRGEWTLTFEPSKEEKEPNITCSCKKFEHWGILCCHALRIFNDHDVKVLPSKYILKRWTKEARFGIVYDTKRLEIEVDPELECTNRYNRLCQMFNKLANDASECIKAFTFVYQAGLELDKKVYELRVKHQSNDIDKTRGVNEDDDGGQIANKKIGWKKRERKKIKSIWVDQKCSTRKRASASKTMGNKSSQVTKV